MSKFIKSILCFICVVLIAYPISLTLWESVIPNGFKSNLTYPLGSTGFSYSRFKEVKETRNIDVLFLGSSHTYRGFDTRIFKAQGLKVFNLGSSAQTHLQTNVLLKRYLTQLNPKLIIYDVYPNMFQSNGVEAAIDLVTNDSNDLNSIQMVFKVNHLKSYNTLILGLFRDLFNLNIGFVEQNLRKKETYISGGYVERDSINTKNEQFVKRRFNFNPDQFIAFEENLALIKDKNIKVLLVYTPINSVNYSSYLENENFDHKMRQYGSYINFNQKLKLDNSLNFYDSNHLNKSGAQIYSKEILSIIQDENLLRKNL